MQVTDGWSKLINARMRSWHGAWRRRRPRVRHRRLRLLRPLAMVVHLALAMLMGLTLMMQPLLILQSSHLPMVILR